MATKYDSVAIVFSSDHHMVKNLLSGIYQTTPRTRGCLRYLLSLARLPGTLSLRKIPAGPPDVRNKPGAFPIPPCRLFAEFSDKLFHLRHPSLVYEISIVRFPLCDLIIDGSEHDLLHLIEVVCLS